MTDHRCSVDYQSQRNGGDPTVVVLLRKLEQSDITPDAFVGRLELLVSALRGMYQVCERKHLSPRARWQVVETVLYAAKLTIGGQRHAD